MSDLFLARIGEARARPVHIRGNAAAFLRLATQSSPRRTDPAEIRRSEARIPRSASEVLDALRVRLFSGDLRLRPTEARAVVRRLRLSQGVDIDDIYLGLKGRTSVVAPMRQEAAVLAALDDGHIRWATAQFLTEIEHTEDPGDRVAQAETVTSILAEMFWFAIRNGQFRTAEFLVNRLMREAQRRGVLWAYPEALYLRGNLLHELWLRGDSTSDAGSPSRLSQAKLVLERAIRYAMRVPRIDIVIDALRLRIYIERKPAERRRLFLALRIWSQRAQDGEEKLLALFDLIRHHVTVGLRPPEQVFRELSRTVRHCPHLTSGRGYLATANCYLALATSSSAALRKALRSLNRVVARLHPNLRAPFAREAEAFQARLNIKSAGRLCKRAPFAPVVHLRRTDEGL